MTQHNGHRYVAFTATMCHSGIIRFKEMFVTVSTAPTMSAAMLTHLPAESLDLRRVPMPRIESRDDVLLRVEACGICGTDLHILRGESYHPPLPFTLGHEPAGVVIAAGDGARNWVGKRAILTLFTGDGTCPSCRIGDERLCPHLESITGVLVAQGAYADYVRVHASQLVELPDTLSALEAAVLVDAGATAANSVRVALEANPARVLVIGAGPVGFLVAEILRSDGVAHMVVESNKLRRNALAALGHDVIASFDDISGLSAVVIDCTGAPAAMSGGVDALGPHGLYILAGYARVPDFDFGEVSHKEVSIRGVRSGRREDLERITSLAAARRVRLISAWPLTRINEALGALRAGSVAGKAVIVPDAVWNG
jgi:(R,R)-butanediol dehydrogenase/meso-butanediol dehydrogenase/diacetyl reductase